MDFPPLYSLRQTHPQPRVADVADAVRREWAGFLPSRLRPGMRVAVGVGSRGIANLQPIVTATLDAVRACGGDPFIIAAMGSHGGATAQGQAELLASYGVTADRLGVPVVTDMDAVEIGTNSFGEPVWWDQNALRADAVLTVSRIKPHTDFRGRYESGIVKMLAIGLGKQRGAAQHHRWGVRGLRDLLPETAKIILERTPFVGGLAVLENAQEETARVQVVGRDELLAVEPGLLAEAHRLMGRIPFEQLDLLVIGELGKNYSGAGIDPNVVGRLLIETVSEEENPKITRICVLDVSPESHGNGTGIGIADLTTERAIAAIDPKPFRMNNLTACFLWRSKLPLAFATDRECVAAGIATCWQPSPGRLRAALIPNTLEVARMWVSAPLADEARTRDHLEVGGAPVAWPFGPDGNLDQVRLFPHSVRGRRPA